MQSAGEVVIQTLSPIRATENNNTPSTACLWSRHFDTLSAPWCQSSDIGAAQAIAPNRRRLLDLNAINAVDTDS